MLYFDRKITLIVGAHTAIGRRMAPQLAKRGARLILVGPSSASLQNASQASELFHPFCDLEILQGSDRLAIHELVRKTSVRFSRIDLLVNCLGYPTTSCSESDSPWDDLWGDGARAFVETMQACHRLMVKQGKGQIVNVVEASGPLMSGVGRSGLQEAALGMTKALRRQSRNTGVRVNFFCPMNLADEEGRREEMVGQFEPELHMTAVLDAFERDRSLVIEPLSAYVLWHLSRMVPDPVMDVGGHLIDEFQKLCLREPFVRSNADR